MERRYRSVQSVKMVSISGISSLGHVFRERNIVTNRVISLTMPTLDTSYTRNINLLGKKRIMLVQGIFEGSTTAIANFISDVEGWVNSGIQSTRTYTDSFGNSYAVICVTFEWEYTTESKRKITYFFELVQGGTIS